MTQYTLGTVGFEIQNTGGAQATAELTNLANVATTKVAPAARDVIAQLQFVSRVNKQVAESTKVLTYEMAALSNTHLNQVSRGLDNYEAALANTRQGMNNFGVVTQQAGYQIGDFLVQIQSGTSVFVALGQQLTQLVGVLPMMTGFMGLSTSALVGLSAGLGIAIPLITAFAGLIFNASQNLGSSSEKIKEYKSSLDSLKSSINDINISLEGFNRGISDENIVAAQVAIDDLKNSLFELRNTEVSGFLDTFTRAGNIVEQQALLVELEKQLEVYRQQAAEEERVTAAARLRANEFRDSVREEFLERQRVTDAHAESVEQMGKALNNQRLMTIAAEDALSKYSMMRSVAAGVANELARGADAAFRLAQQRIAASGLTYSGRGGDPRTANQQGYGEFTYTGPALDANNNPIVRGGGGGGRAEDRLKKQIELTKELTQAEKDRQTIVKSIEGSLEDGFMAMVQGTKSVKDAFKQMAYEIIKELYRVLVVQRLVGGISSAVGMFTGRSTGSFGLPFGLATGGSMMPNRPYLVGENGPELVIPRHSGTVVNANQTAGAMSNSGGVTVQNNITVTGSDAAMVRAEVAKMIPQITNATKAAVIDARLRGGQMKSAFS